MRAFVHQRRSASSRSAERPPRACAPAGERRPHKDRRELIEPQREIGATLDPPPLGFAVRLMPDGGGQSRRLAQPAKVHFEPFERVTHPASRLIGSNFGDERSAGAQRRGMRGEPGGPTAQDSRSARRHAFFRRVTDGKPVESPAHRGHDS